MIAFRISGMSPPVEQIHHSIGAVLHRIAQLLKFFFDIRSGGGVADVRVDLAARCHPDAHRLEVGVPDVGRNDHPAARHFVADQFRRDLFPSRHILHLFGDLPKAGVMHLGPHFIGPTFFNPLAAHTNDSLYRRTGACERHIVSSAAMSSIPSQRF